MLNPFHSPTLTNNPSFALSLQNGHHPHETSGLISKIRVNVSSHDSGDIPMKISPMTGEI